MDGLGWAIFWGVIGLIGLVGIYLSLKEEKRDKAVPMQRRSRWSRER